MMIEMVVLDFVLCIINPKAVLDDEEGGLWEKFKVQNHHPELHLKIKFSMYGSLQFHTRSRRLLFVNVH